MGPAIGGFQSSNVKYEILVVDLCASKAPFLIGPSHNFHFLLSYVTKNLVFALIWALKLCAFGANLVGAEIYMCAHI